MSKNSHTPPCNKENKSPKYNSMRSASRNQIAFAKPPYNKRGQISGSRSASRLINQSDRCPSRSLKKETKDGIKPVLSLAKKKHSLSNAQVAVLVSHYESLKVAYNDLLQTKRRDSANQDRIESVLDDNMKLKKQNEKLKNQNKFYQDEIQRIKKECVRIIDIEGFKIKKLEQTLQQKELMLQFLRTNPLTLQNLNQTQTNVFLQSTPIFRSPDLNHKALTSNLSLLSLQQISAIEVIQRNNFLQSSIHGQNKITIESEDSLIFSKDKSKSNNVHLESIVMSPPSTKQQVMIQPNCPTFDLKDIDDYKYQLISNQQKPKRKQLKIATDQKLILGLNSRDVEDDIMTHSTKKRINLPYSKDNSSDNIVCDEGEKKKKKIDKIEVNLPKEKKLKGKGMK